MKYVAVAIGAIVLLLVILVAYFVGGYNKAIAHNEEVDAAWAEVENQLMRRFELIPNLVETVEGYAGHEKEIFTNLAEARQGYTGAKTVGEKAQVVERYESALSRLLVVVENYPNLKANESFRGLQDELAGTENRISVARMRYNQAVKTLNLYTKKFPSRFFASMAGVESREFFETPEAKQETPEVDFAK